MTCRLFRLLAIICGCVSTPVVTQAQQRPFYYPLPASDAVTITRGVPYSRADTAILAMDVYRPAAGSGPFPAVILYTMYWPPDRSARETNDWATTWARIMAGHGVAAIVADIRAEPGTGTSARPTRALGDDFQRLVAHLVERAAQYGIDRDRLTLFAASGAVAPAITAVQDPRQTAIRAAVMYYGGAGADVTTLRLDLPMLYVRAGLDSPGMNAALGRIAAQALEQNAPVTIINHHAGDHGFEGRNDDAATRRVIAETIDFIKRSTEPAYQAAIASGRLRALAAAQMGAGNYRDAAATFAELVRQRPTDGAIRLSYGSALLADKQFAPACTELRRITPPAFGALVPAARACVLAGAPDSAMAWLESVPSDWVRSPFASRLRTDSVFAPLWARADFQALVR